MNGINGNGSEGRGTECHKGNIHSLLFRQDQTGLTAGFGKWIDSEQRERERESCG